MWYVNKKIFLARAVQSNFFLFIIVAGFFLTYMTLSGCTEPSQVILLAGSGMKGPCTEIAADFERKTGIKVQTQFEGSSILRDYILDFKTGDVFLPGDKGNLDKLAENGLVKESSFLAWHKVAILVDPAMADRIKGLDDLADEGVRLVISNPRLASLGRIVMAKIIERHPRGQDILKNVVVYGSSTQDVLRLYKQGGIDAIIEWDVMAATPEGKGLVKVPLKVPYQVSDMLYVGLLTTAANKAAAKQFYDYLSTTGREIFREHGYDTDISSTK